MAWRAGICYAAKTNGKYTQGEAFPLGYLAQLSPGLTGLHHWPATFQKRDMGKETAVFELISHVFVPQKREAVTYFDPLFLFYSASCLESF